LSELTLDCNLHTVSETWYVSRRKESAVSWRQAKVVVLEDQRFRFAGHRRRSYTFRNPHGLAVRSILSSEPAVAIRFQALAREWKRETIFASTANQMFLLPSYQRIIGLGPSAIPEILRDLQTEPNHWFWALAAITGENPVAPEQAGNVRAMRTAWLQWGQARGIL
jgi:hypothetical protein